jgi:quinol monooxygenase YgiN
MIAVTRYQVPDDEIDGFRELAVEAVRVLAGRTGCEQIRFSRNIDEPGLWLLISSWRGVGDYRRALSHPEVKLRAVPLMYRCIDEPTAYEDLTTWDPDGGLAEHQSDLAIDAPGAGPET